MFQRLALAASVSVLGFFAVPETAKAQDLWLGQIVIGGWNFCPRTTIPADGQLLAISSNQALFALYGTMYGGDGRTSFGIPDLRGRIAMHHGQGPGLAPVQQGEKGGRNEVTLSQLNLPSHSHTITNDVTTSAKVGPGAPGTFAAGAHIAAGASAFASTGNPNQELNPATVDVTVNSTAGNTGGSQGFSIANPFLGLQFCVVTQGIFPSRN